MEQETKPAVSALQVTPTSERHQGAMDTATWDAGATRRSGGVWGTEELRHSLLQALPLTSHGISALRVAGVGKTQKRTSKEVIT